MKNKIMVSDLIRGMNNLTRMREMIDELLDGMGGRLIKLANEHSFTGLSFMFEGIDMSWETRVCKTANRHKIFVVHCRRKEDGLDSGLALSYHTGSQTIMSMTDVEFVYDGLQVLLDGLLERFPQIRQDAEIVARLAAKQL